MSRAVLKRRRLETGLALNNRAVDLELQCELRTRVNSRPILAKIRQGTSTLLEATQAAIMHKPLECKARPPQR